MEAKVFDSLVTKVFDQCANLLDKKGVEYKVGNDRLEQFKSAAVLLNTDSRKALAGMMVKHTTKLYGFITTEGPPRMGDWEEVINDNINYLVLLRGLLEEDGSIVRRHPALPKGAK